MALLLSVAGRVVGCGCDTVTKCRVVSVTKCCREGSWVWQLLLLLVLLGRAGR